MHAAIIERELFDAVQAHLHNNTVVRRRRPIRAMSAPLKGLLHDALGRPMTPTFTPASGRERINRYHVSSPLQQGRCTAAAESVITRLPGGEVEDFVLGRLRVLHRAGGPDAGWDELKASLLRVEAASASVSMEIAAAAVLRDGASIDQEIGRLARSLSADDHLQLMPGDPSTLQLFTAIRLKRRGGRTSLSLPDGSDHAPHRLRPDPTLISALRRAHKLKRHHGLKIEGALPRTEPTTPDQRYDQRLLAMAFLAPDLQADILAGRQPAGLALQRFITNPTPLAWVDQREHLQALARGA